MVEGPPLDAVVTCFHVALQSGIGLAVHGSITRDRVDPFQHLGHNLRGMAKKVVMEDPAVGTNVLKRRHQIFLLHTFHVGQLSRCPCQHSLYQFLFLAHLQQHVDHGPGTHSFGGQWP